MEAALQINGCDEDFCGSHGYEDQEFAERMQNYGVRWFRDSTNSLYGFSMKDEVLPRLRKLRPASTNRALILLKRVTGYIIPDSPTDPYASRAVYNGRPCNDWSISEYRERLGNV